jgi:hypothetical protein
MEVLFALTITDILFSYREPLDQGETLWGLLARNGTGIPG